LQLRRRFELRHVAQSDAKGRLLLLLLLLLLLYFIVYFDTLDQFWRQNFGGGQSHYQNI
jgi:hypothetical protein